MTRPAAQKQEQDFLAKGCGGVGWMSCKVVGLTGSQLAKVRSSLCRHYEDPWGVKGWPSGSGWSNPGADPCASGQCLITFTHEGRVYKSGH